MYWKKQTVCLAHLVTRLDSTRFVSVGLHEVDMYNNGQPQGRHKLVKAINKAAVGTRNELGHIQWQHSMA
jgi:hypothetical protein